MKLSNFFDILIGAKNKPKINSKRWKAMIKWFTTRKINHDWTDFELELLNKKGF